MEFLQQHKQLFCRVLNELETVAKWLDDDCSEYNSVCDFDCESLPDEVLREQDEEYEQWRLDYYGEEYLAEEWSCRNDGYD